MNRKQRLIALLTAAAMVFTMAFTVLFIVHESEHHCTGVDCQVCQQMNHCVKLLDNITPKPEQAVTAITLVFAVVLCLGVLSSAKKVKTLISLKTKLSN